MNGDLFKVLTLANNLLIALSVIFLISRIPDFSEFMGDFLLITSVGLSLFSYFFFIFQINKPYTAIQRSKLGVSIFGHGITAILVAYLFLNYQVFYGLSCISIYVLTRLILNGYGRIGLAAGKSFWSKIILIVFFALVLSIIALYGYGLTIHSNRHFIYADDQGIPAIMGYRPSGLLAFCILLNAAMLAIFAELGADKIPANDPLPATEPLNDDPKARLVSFRWQKPHEAAHILKSIPVFNSEYLLPQLDQIIDKFPLYSYNLSSRQQTANQSLRSQISGLKQTIIASSTLQIKHLEDAFCTKCFCRPQTIHIQNNKTQVCPKCHRNDQLVGDVKEIIGITAGPQSTAPEMGIFTVIAWDNSAKHIVDAPYQKLRITFTENLNMDWFIAALATWLNETQHQRKSPLTIIFPEYQSLSPNSTKIFAKLRKEKHIVLRLE